MALSVIVGLYLVVNNRHNIQTATRYMSRMFESICQFSFVQMSQVRVSVSVRGETEPMKCE